MRIVLIAIALFAFARLLPGQEGPPPLLAGYLPHYRMSAIDLETLDYLSHLYYFALSPDSTGHLGRVDAEGLFTPVENISGLQAHLDSLDSWRDQRELEVYLVVGGWVGSLHFGKALADTISRARLVGELLAFCLENGLDGVDLDWESYRSPVDKTLYGVFISELRLAFDPEGLGISVTVNPAHSDMAPYFHKSDVVQLMSYGRIFSEETQVPMSTLEDWVEAWIAAGHEASRLVIGIPAFAKTPEDNSSLLYRNIIAQHNPPPFADRVFHDGIVYYFNGQETVKAKAAYAREARLAGVMLWELGQDLPPANDRALLPHIFDGLYPRTGSPPTHQAGDGTTLYPHPHPAGDLLTIQCMAFGGHAPLLSLIDGQGRLLRSFSPGTTSVGESLTLDISGIPAGIYILQWKTNNRRGCERIIKY